MALDVTVYKIIHPDDKSAKYAFTDDIDIIRDGKELKYPEWAKNFIAYRDEEEPDWVKYKKETGIDYTKFKFIEAYYDEILCLDPETNEEIGIDPYGVPWINVRKPYFIGKCVGGMCGEMPSKFYQYIRSLNDCEIFIWSYGDLQKIVNMFDTSNENDAILLQRFNSNIVNSFIEGETVVVIDW